MPTKTKVTTAPFDRSGNLMHYPQDQCDYSGVTYTNGVRSGSPTWFPPDWRPNEPFEAVMTIELGVTSGRSAKYVHWRDQDGHQFPMFVTDLVDVVANGSISQGAVRGLWMVAKRGANYGLRLVTTDG